MYVGSLKHLFETTRKCVKQTNSTYTFPLPAREFISQVFLLAVHGSFSCIFMTCFYRHAFFITRYIGRVLNANILASSYDYNLSTRSTIFKPSSSQPVSAAVTAVIFLSMNLLGQGEEKKAGWLFLFPLSQ